MITRVIQGGNTSMTQPYHLAGQKGYSYNHFGVDLTGFNGQYNVVDWIVAHSDGIVVDLRRDCNWYEDGSYGNYVLLKHPNGYFTLYAHLAYGTLKVNVGEPVKKGQVLGLMGNTGHSLGAHLHLSLRLPTGEKIDPEPYLNADLPGMETYKPLKVNGSWNKGTTKRLQKIFGTPIDGIVSNQFKTYKPLCPACNATTSWRFVKNPKSGSDLIKAMQRWLKVDADGWIGPNTIKALQKKFKVAATGKIDKALVKKIQKWINKKLG